MLAYKIEIVRGVREFWFGDEPAFRVESDAKEEIATATTLDGARLAARTSLLEDGYEGHLNIFTPDSREYPREGAHLDEWGNFVLETSSLSRRWET